LVSDTGCLKICDFGLAKTYDFEMRLTSVVVTLWYRAPEILLCQQYNSSVDIWSAACIIAEIFQRRALFPGTSEVNQLERILELTGRPGRDEWPQGTSIARESFLDTQQQQPKDLCPRLCEHSNDLLNVSYIFRVDSILKYCFFSLANVGLQPRTTTVGARMSAASVFPRRTTLKRSAASI
jgi:cyclin-dependent kinase 4